MKNKIYKNPCSISRSDLLAIEKYKAAIHEAPITIGVDSV